MLGKLSEAVNQLAAGEGNVKSRLKCASEYLCLINKSMLPPELQDKWDLIWKDLNRYPAQYGRTALEMTLIRIRNSTGSRIAHRIFSLYVELRSHC